GGLIYLVCVTGTLDVFVSELRAWEQPRPVPQLDVRFIDTALAAGARLAPRGASIYLMLPRMEAGGARLEVYGGGRETDYSLGTDGHVIGELRTPFTDFLDRTHMYLCLPQTVGTFLVGLIGVALLSLLLSGLLAHPRIFRDAFTLRWGGSKRLQEADLHNRLSVWGLPFHLAVTLTGAFFGLTNALLLAVALIAHNGGPGRITGLLDGPSPAHDERPAPLPPVSSMLARLHVSRDLLRINYIGVQDLGVRGAAVTFELAVPDQLIRGERYVFDGAGRYLGPAGYASGPVGKQAYAAAAALHFGAFGGLAVRLAYGILGFALCVVCAGGVSIWTARRRDQGRPVPRIERLWLGTVWGVLVALSAAATTALATSLPPVPVFWSVFLLTTSLAVARRDARSASRLCRALLAAGLALVAILHTAKFWTSMHPGAAVIDGLGLLAAVRLTASLFPGVAVIRTDAS
ncbi:MAG TPA: PepSY-associated TM helix domain-containing protein, partial [Caulobacteraceae bacterium]|nr:PepSY-associated TM helix domain-containing protein [Caulobacteraceae bacterium]